MVPTIGRIVHLVGVALVGLLLAGCSHVSASRINGACRDHRGLHTAQPAEAKPPWCS